MQLGIIGSFEWVSETNAVAPMDFRVSPIAARPSGSTRRRRTAHFDRPIHIS